MSFSDQDKRRRVTYPRYQWRDQAGRWVRDGNDAIVWLDDAPCAGQSGRSYARTHWPSEAARLVRIVRKQRGRVYRSSGTLEGTGRVNHAEVMSLPWRRFCSQNDGRRVLITYRVKP